MSKEDIKIIILSLVFIGFFFMIFSLNTFNNLCYIVGKISLSVTLALIVWHVILEALEKI